MKKFKSFLFLLSLSTILSCGDNSKDSTIDKPTEINTTMSTITWTTDSDPDLILGQSNATTEADIVSEIIQVFNIIKTEKILLTSNVLVSIDGTNSIIFFSDQDNDEDDDDNSSGKTIAVSFETCKFIYGKNANDFEKAALDSLRQAIKSKTSDKKIMADYTVYFRTDTDDAEILEQNGL